MNSTRPDRWGSARGGTRVGRQRRPACPSPAGRSSRAPRRPRRCACRGKACPIRAAVGVHLTKDGRRRPTQVPGDRPERQTRGQTPRNLLTPLPAQPKLRPPPRTRAPSSGISDELPATSSAAPNAGRSALPARPPRASPRSSLSSSEKRITTTPPDRRQRCFANQPRVALTS